MLDEETLEQFAPTERNEMLRCLAPITQGEPEVFGDDVFLFFWRLAQNTTDSEWLLVFYSRIIFFAATASSERLGSTA